MEPEDLRKLLKRILIVGGFFALALVFYVLGRDGSKARRGILIAYALVVSLTMVLAILLQSGRGGGLAGLGGLGADSLLGARAATPIAKATYVMGALFLFVCMLIARLGEVTGESSAATPGIEGPVPSEQPLREETPTEESPEGPTGGGTSSTEPSGATGTGESQ